MCAAVHQFQALRGRTGLRFTLSKQHGVKDVIIAQLIEENRQFRETVQQLNSKIETLQEDVAKLKKNSRNSSKPASSDIEKPKKPRSSQQTGKPRTETPNIASSLCPRRLVNVVQKASTAFAVPYEWLTNA